MSFDDLLQTFPAKRIMAIDGLAVTADIWEDAHAYHRQIQRFETLLYQGWGIVTGLEVIASDPPDTSVYILPGIAVDQTGQSIVLPQPVAYDVGEEMEGLLYLILSYGESPPRADEGGREDTPQYVHAEFSLAASTILPSTPYVELARMRRQRRTDAFADARDEAKPGPNEIDLRFRRQMRIPKDVSISVCYLGDTGDKKHGQGASFLGRAAGISDRYRVTIEDDVQLAPGIENSTLVYLVGSGNIELSSGQMNGLSNYVKRGRGTLFIEGLDEAAEASFSNMLTAIDMEPQPLQSGHRLLQNPYLFAAPPVGYDAARAPDLLFAGGVIVSNANYGLLWQGAAKDGQPSRDQIRSAMEFGSNILAYAIERRRS